MKRGSLSRGVVAQKPRFGPAHQQVIYQSAAAPPLRTLWGRSRAVVDSTRIATASAPSSQSRLSREGSSAGVAALSRASATLRKIHSLRRPGETISAVSLSKEL